MHRLGEDSNKTPEDQLESPLRVQWRKLSHRWLFSDDEFQLGDNVDYELSVRAKGIHKGIAPSAQFAVALAEKRPNEALKSLSECRIRDVALVLIELACCEQA